jgi:hypothetical protein
MVTALLESHESGCVIGNNGVDRGWAIDNLLSETKCFLFKNRLVREGRFIGILPIPIMRRYLFELNQIKFKG